VVDIKDRLYGLDECLVSDTRRFVMETTDILPESLDGKTAEFPFWFFLFNDLLLVARQKGKRFKAYLSLPLADIKVLDVSDNTIAFLYRDKSIGFVFSSKVVKTAWYKQLQNCIFRQKKERYQTSTQ
jgi:hypothetical protein